MKKPSKLITRHGIDTAGYDLARTKYYELCIKIDNPAYDEYKSAEAFENLCRKFADILHVCAVEAAVPESCTIFLGDPKKYIPHAGMVTDTTQFRFTIGLFREFYIVMEICNSHNLKLMKDEFFYKLFKLAELGKFNFQEAEKPDKSMRNKSPQLFNKTGNFYKLFRNYFLFEAQYGIIRSLGNISVHWNHDISFDDLIVKLSDSFRLMYEINLLLWRPDNKSIKLEIV